MIIVTVVNNAKYATLREPLAFSDFFLYLQAVQHPRLYLPFLGILPLVLLVVSVGTLLVLGLVLEVSYFSWLSLTALWLLTLAVAKYYLLSKLSLSADISSQLKRDYETFGVFASLCIHAFKAPKFCVDLQQSLLETSPFATNKAQDAPDPALLSDLVVVQSESFFDARRLSSNIKTDILSEYDQCLKASEKHGCLEVPAWGANTMRTEFAFLTSLTPEQLGLAQFYPYRQLIGLDVPSLVGHLKQLGYHCVCIHPHAASFFMRDKFFKQLGFDEFIDEKQFVGAQRVGPYVADLAVTGKIKEVLNSSDKPCFIFAITMENHGPLHLESLEGEEWLDYYKNQPEAGMDDLTVYLRHLKNANKMISQLCDVLSRRDKQALFSFYGDHVPAMSKIFEKLGYEDSRSNYFIWSNFEGRESITGIQKPASGEVLKVEQLAQHLIQLLKKAT